VGAIERPGHGEGQGLMWRSCLCGGESRPPMDLARLQTERSYGLMCSRAFNGTRGLVSVGRSFQSRAKKANPANANAG
jgi:hypothetical protein